MEGFTQRAIGPGQRSLDLHCCVFVGIKRELRTEWSISIRETFGAFGNPSCVNYSSADILTTLTPTLSEYYYGRHHTRDAHDLCSFISGFGHLEHDVIDSIKKISIVKNTLLLIV